VSRVASGRPGETWPGPRELAPETGGKNVPAQAGPFEKKNPVAGAGPPGNFALPSSKSRSCDQGRRRTARQQLPAVGCARRVMKSSPPSSATGRAPIGPRLMPMTRNSQVSVSGKIGPTARTLSRIGITLEQCRVCCTPARAERHCLRVPSRPRSVVFLSTSSLPAVRSVAGASSSFPGQVPVFPSRVVGPAKNSAPSGSAPVLCVSAALHEFRV